MALTVGERVQTRMLELHTNSAEVARKAGLERTFVHDLISGRKKTVTAEALIALAKALQCLPEELVGKQGEIQRSAAAGIDIIGIIEQDVWRKSAPKILGTMTAHDGGRPNAKAYIVRGDEAASVGIKDGSAVIVDVGGEVRPGDIALIERKRNDDLRELSLRRVATAAAGALIFLSLDGDAAKTIDASQETAQIIGPVLRSILLFATTVM